jgi:hypothetical protein
MVLARLPGCRGRGGSEKMRLKILISVLTITGFAVELSFVAEAFLSSTTYDMNEAVQFVIVYFLLSWVCIAGVVLASRWSATTIALRIAFAVNLFLAKYAIQALFAHHLHTYHT